MLSAVALRSVKARSAGTYPTVPKCRGDPFPLRSDGLDLSWRPTGWLEEGWSGGVRAVMKEWTVEEYAGLRDEDAEWFLVGLGVFERGRGVCSQRILQSLRVNDFVNPFARHLFARWQETGECWPENQRQWVGVLEDGARFQPTAKRGAVSNAIRRIRDMTQRRRAYTVACQLRERALGRAPMVRANSWN